MASFSSTSTAAIKSSLSSSATKQKTLRDYVSLAGPGLFTGRKSEITLCPAPEDTGIRFQRIDLPGKPIFPASVEFVYKTPRCTILGNEQHQIQSVEHILSAIKAYEIDNLLIEVSGPEIPACDGSAMPFVSLIERSGIACLSAPKKIYHLSTPIFWSQGDVHLVALPSDEFRISYTLSYPNSALLGSQFYSIAVNPESFKNELASCRTFCLYEEIVPLIEKGLIKGGTLDNGVIIKENAVINPEGLRYPDECVRHKVLDMIGDISLVAIDSIPLQVQMHLIVIRGGHYSNTALAREIVNHIRMETGF